MKIFELFEETIGVCQKNELHKHKNAVAVAPRDFLACRPP